MDGSGSKRGEESGAAAAAGAAFLCSPIPRDPSQVFFVEARARRQVGIFLFELLPHVLIRRNVLPWSDEKELPCSQSLAATAS